MNKDVSVTPTRRQRQETFWPWMDATVRQLAGNLTTQTLDMGMEDHLQAIRRIPDKGSSVHADLPIFCLDYNDIGW